MKAPDTLSPDAKKIWQKIVQEFEITHDALLILESALVNWDLSQAALRDIRERGAIVNGRRNQSLEVLRITTGLMLRSLKQLGITPSNPVGRPSENYFPPLGGKKK